MATAHHRTSDGLNSSSGGELKLYLMGKRNTTILKRPIIQLKCARNCYAYI